MLETAVQKEILKSPQKRSRMFGIFKSKYNLINSGLMKGMTDVHSHVLPGVDDGSPDINASLSLLRYMESIGLRKVWLTPHIVEDYPILEEARRVASQIVAEDNWQKDARWQVISDHLKDKDTFD